MSAGKDKLEKVLRFVKGNVDKLFIAMIGVALLFIGFLYLSESNSPARVPMEPQTVTLDPKITPDPPDPTGKNPPRPTSGLYWDVVFMTHQMEPVEKSNYEILRKLNMFDPKEVRDADQLKEQANKIVMGAKQLKEQGKLDEALKEVQKALELSLNLRAAEQLKAEIEAEKKKAEATPTPAPGARGAPAATSAPTPKPAQ